MSDDLNIFPGQQFTRPDRDIFGCFSDVLPDRSGRTLSPAYDMKPSLNGYQSLLISSTSNEANLEMLLEASDDYMISKTREKEILKEVTEAVSTWRTLANRLGLAQREMDMFAGVLDRRTEFGE